MRLRPVPYFSLVACSLIACVISVGCGGGENSNTNGEVPGPGENAPSDDPGPAPNGQSEPEDADPPTSEDMTTDSDDDSDDSSNEASTAVTITPGDWAAVQKMVAAHKGKVVVVDLWALTCIPCRREFPHLVELSKSHADKVACISVCCDYLGDEDNPPKTIEPKALEFLAKQRAGFENVLMTTAQPDFFKAISLGSLPAIYVYDKNGKQATRLDNDVPEFADEGFTYKDHVIPLIEQLLAEE